MTDIRALVEDARLDADNGMVSIDMVRRLATALERLAARVEELERENQHWIDVRNRILARDRETVAERDALRAENEALRTEVSVHKLCWTEAVAREDALRAENEELKNAR